ncbi:hypothetical protein ZIOFF_002870 [Zingiber officinale]|uniref:Uncharacterized protein n=1 Tax=Zingiber officinale TaxID=94328 RepID=A0A8J5IRT5_ZINOF|nr:hypothetical protein ZIOFF_002870 [Zingiber officinale]
MEGLWVTLINNVGFVLRNIYSKKSLQDFTHVDGLNLYGCISIYRLAPLPGGHRRGGRTVGGGVPHDVGDGIRPFDLLPGASMAVFQNPVHPLNGLNSANAILGTFLYSYDIANDNKKS